MFPFFKPSTPSSFQTGMLTHSIIATDTLTPLIALECLNAKMLLESAHIEMGKGRYSILIIQVAFTLIKENQEYFLLDSSKQRHSLKAIDPTKDYLQWLEYFKNLAPNTEDLKLSCPLPLGGIGYLGYEFFSEIENIHFNAPKRIEHYDCAFVFPRTLMIFDHLYDQAHLFYINYHNEANPHTHDLNLIIQSLKHYTPKSYTPQKYPYTLTDHEIPYKDFIRHIQAEIYQGNLMQCVPSRSIQITTPLPPLDAYKNLRRENPSPYMFYCDFDDFIIIGASPEIMVRLENSTLTLCPIAGSIKRGKNLAEDKLLEQQLLNDPKESAEHLMLVDLSRNDLSKVAQINTVNVTHYKTIQRYAHITHIASEITAKLSPDKTLRDILHATFPAGTVSGAPKIAAIQTIASLEPYARGIYAGAIGYIDSSGDFNSCIAIRTALYQKGVYYLQAGSGIVYDSDPETEWQETQNKMKSLLQAILQDQNLKQHPKKRKDMK